MSFANMPSGVRIEGPYGRGSTPLFEPNYELPETLDYDEFAHFDVLERIDGGGGYDWTEGALMRAKQDGSLYFVVSSGCSCNDFMSNVGQYATPVDLRADQVANWQEAVEKAKVVAMDTYGGWTSDTVATFAERCMKNEELS